MKRGARHFPIFIAILLLCLSIEGCEPRPCIEDVALGPWVDTVADLDIHEGCEEDGYIILHPGWRGIDTIAGISALRDRHPDLLDVPGVIGHGSGLCCRDESDAACIGLMLASNTLTPAELTEALAEVFTGEDLNCFGIRVDIIGYQEPRCEEGPDCLPLAMCPEVTGPGCCPVAPEFDPAAPRIPAIDEGSPMAGLELPEEEAECTYDGECVRNGCGQYCNAYTAPGFISTCECYPALADTFCGCVEGRCRWFRQ